MNRSLCGKGTWDNYVRISFDYHRHSIIYKFNTEVDALDFYEEYEYSGKKLGLLNFFKYKYCKHNNTYDLKGTSDTHYYKYCPDCNKAEYIDIETPERKEERRNQMNKNHKLDQIKELRLDIESKQRKLKRLENEFNEKFNEDI